MKRFAVVLLATGLVLGTDPLSASAANRAPVTVSPGGIEISLLADTRCPTFSWGFEIGTVRSELRIYRIDKAEGSPMWEPVVRQELPGNADSWTPPDGSCLDYGGQYAWLVGLTSPDGKVNWSMPRLFGITGAPTLEEIDRAVDVLEAAMAAGIMDRRSLDRVNEPAAEREPRKSRADRGEPSSPITGEALPAVIDELPPPMVHLVESYDVNPVFGGTLVIGPTDDGNLAFDANEIMARKSHAVSTLHLNAEGGQVVTGDGLEVRGNLTVAGDILSGGDIDMKGNTIWNVSRAYLGLEVRTGTSCSLYGATAICPFPKKILGGGCVPTKGDTLRWTHPRGDNMWSCAVDGNLCDVTAYAVCANIQ